MIRMVLAITSTVSFIQTLGENKMGKEKVTYFQCDHCTNVFTIKARRGRPPKYCDGCQDKAPTRAEVKRRLAQERVDRLTAKLKARGLTITDN
jgi:hypothetical protein